MYYLTPDIVSRFTKYKVHQVLCNLSDIRLLERLSSLYHHRAVIGQMSRGSASLGESVGRTTARSVPWGPKVTTVGTFRVSQACLLISKWTYAKYQPVGVVYPFRDIKSGKA